MDDPAVYHIRVVRLAKVLPENVTILLPGQAPPQEGAADTIYFPTELPDMTKEDECLGRFLRNWGKLEHTLGNLFITLLGGDPRRARTLLISLSGKSLRDAIEDLATVALDAAEQNTLRRLLTRFSKVSKWRNNIVHGYWIGEILVWNSKGGDLSIKLEVMREYPVLGDDANSLANPLNQSVRARHLFRTKKIDEIGKTALALRDDVAAFIGGLRTPTQSGF